MGAVGAADGGEGNRMQIPSDDSFRSAVKNRRDGDQARDNKSCEGAIAMPVVLEGGSTQVHGADERKGQVGKTQVLKQVF